MDTLSPRGRRESYAGFLSAKTPADVLQAAIEEATGNTEVFFRDFPTADGL